MKTIFGSSKPLIIFESEILQIASQVEQWPNLETGGDLFGYWTHSGAAIVHYALGPGPHSRRHSTSFYQDADFLEREGTRLNNTFGLQHIGEWHSHHQLGLDHPSGGDISTVQGALRKYGFPRFALVICNFVPGRGATPFKAARPKINLNSFLFESQSTSPYLTCPWIVLSESSPIRLSHDGGRGPMPACVTPQYELRPGRITLADLRDEVSIHRPVETLGNYWYTTELGQARLKEELDRLKMTGILPQMELNTLNEVVIRITMRGMKAAYFLPEDFPKSCPTLWLEVIGKRRVSVPGERFGSDSWTEASHIADLHHKCFSAKPKKVLGENSSSSADHISNDLQSREQPAVPPPLPSLRPKFEPVSLPSATENPQADKGNRTPPGDLTTSLCPTNAGPPIRLEDSPKLDAKAFPDSPDDSFKGSSVRVAVDPEMHSEQLPVGEEIAATGPGTAEGQIAHGEQRRLEP